MSPSRRATSILELLFDVNPQEYDPFFIPPALLFVDEETKINKMQTRASQLCLAFSAVLGLCALGRAQSQAPAQAPADKPAASPVAAATATVNDTLTPEQARQRFLADLRNSFLDRQGKLPLPDAPKVSTSATDLDELRAEAAAVQAGRGADELLPAYMDMVVLLASRLGIDPPESAMAVYRDRLQPQQALWPADMVKTRAALAAATRQPDFHRRYVYIDGLAQRTTADAAALAATVAAEAAAKVAAAVAPRTRVKFVTYHDKKGRKHTKKVTVLVKPRIRKALPPPDLPVTRSVMDQIDWAKAEDLASAAEEGASGWDDGRGRRARRARRRRKGRCYEWVRMALDKVGLWRNDYRSELYATHRGGRIPVRAFSFGWAMEILAKEAQAQGEQPPKRVPLSKLDLRIDPLVLGSIVVFDRVVCGYDQKSGHIEIITSVDPLQASSYKFHQVKPDCLVKASASGKVHVYVPTLHTEPTAAAR